MSKTHNTNIFTSYYIIGVIAYFNGFSAASSILMFLLTLILLKKEIISDKLSIVLFLAFILGIINCSIQIKESDDLKNIAPSKNTIIEARVASIPTTNYKDRTKFYAEVQKIYDKQLKSNAKTIVTIFDKKNNIEKIEIGDVINLKGKLVLPKKATNPSQFDYSRYLKNFDTFSLLYVQNNDWNIQKKANTKYWKFLQKLNKTRTKIIQEHSKYIKSPNIEILGGIVFGDDAVNPPNEIKNSFINSGLLHILAASGMNVTLIFGLWFFISQKVKIHYRLSIGIGIILILFYTCMTGFGPSILRAALMLIFILIGKLIDRDADNISLLFFVALLLLVYDPALINNIGFQLSFAVTFGLLFSYKIFFEKIENKTLNIIASSCLVPVIAQLYAAPIQMYYFNTFATYSVFANIAILPFLTVVSFLGFLSSIIALIPFVCLYVCKIADIILNPFLSALIIISNFFSNLPNSIIYTKQPSIYQLIIYFVLVLSLTIFFKNKNKNWLFSSIILAGLLIILNLPIKNNQCEIIFFNVGNADSTLIKTPLNKYVLIDTGKAPYKKYKTQAEKIILEYFKDKGIKKLDVLILTHFDSDHTGGSIAILKNIKVDKVLISNVQDNSALTNNILNYLKSHDINYQTPKLNEKILNEPNLILSSVNKCNTLEENESSIINLLTYFDNKILFMADSGTEAYESLDKTNLKNIKILRVGHHGGKNVVDKKMLSELDPQIAIISTGKNPYGHPNIKTLNLLQKAKIKTLRTDKNNAIKVTLNKNSIKISEFNNESKRFSKIMSYNKKQKRTEAL